MLSVMQGSGIGFALHRLRRDQIFCISPQRINFAGKVDVCCFDKTGTRFTYLAVLPGAMR
jgi:magnesium-transporting ATPase (P-type)